MVEMAKSRISLDDAVDLLMPLIAPVLVRRAIAGQLVTYGELKHHAEKLGGPRLFPTQYGTVLGTLNDRLITAGLNAKIPAISGIVVRRDTSLPGSKYLPYMERYLRAVGLKWPDDDVDQRRTLRRIQQKICTFQGWPSVFAKAELPVPLDEDLLADVVASARKAASRLYGPESKEHKRLKTWVASNPARFGMPKASRAIEEYVLPSGDEVDVVFIAPGMVCAVEVKTDTAPVGEVARGVFQVVKYQSLLAAECKTRDQQCEIKGFLCTNMNGLTREIRQLCRCLDVPLRQGA